MQWHPSVTSLLGAAETCKVLELTGQSALLISEPQVQRKTLSQKVKWTAMKKDTYHQSLVSTSMYTHIPMCKYVHMHVRVHVHTYTHVHTQRHYHHRCHYHHHKHHQHYHQHPYRNLNTKYYNSCHAEIRSCFSILGVGLSHSRQEKRKQ